MTPTARLAPIPAFAPVDKPVELDVEFEAGVVVPVVAVAVAGFEFEVCVAMLEVTVAVAVAGSLLSLPCQATTKPYALIRPPGFISLGVDVVMPSVVQVYP